MEEEKKAPLANMNPALFIVITLAVVFVTYQIIGGVISALFTGIEPGVRIKDIRTFRIVISFSQFMFLLIPVILLNMLRGDDVKSTFKLHTPDIKMFLLSLAGILIIQPFLQLYLILQNKIFFSLPFGGETLKRIKDFFDMIEASVMEMVKSHSVIEFMVVVFVIAVTPAICEEFLFRGLIFSNMQKFLKVSYAIIFSGILFALFHFDPFNLIPLIILGIYITLTAYYSGSIYTAIAVHFINNFISAAAVYFIGEEFASNSSLSTPEEFRQLIIWGSISLVIFILILITMRKLFKKNKTGLIAN
ncbi:MAG TPA: CPBP family intramembrane glutamic endopeptidase [Ignavibacteria bacterium]